MYNSALICLGANDADASEQIVNASTFLESLGEVWKATPIYPSDAEYAGDSAPYLNRLVILKTYHDYEALLSATKQYESGVRARAHQRYVAIDIDIVEWNGAIMRPADAAARYFRKGLNLFNIK